MTTYFTYLDTPIGTLLIAGDDDAITRISFARDGAPDRPEAGWIRDDTRFDDASTQLLEYFAGKRREFTLPLRPQGTEFQRKVWKVLLDIPFGETRSYGWLAMAIGNPAASRAVGAANGANPIPIVVPCHRVIGTSGALTGFGGGIPVKKFLLELEGVPLGEKQQTLGFG
jgi:methylated-DNA-[protein]-cysteine S-methyltransferase